MASFRNWNASKVKIESTFAFLTLPYKNCFESARSLVIGPFRNHSASNATGAKNRGQVSRFLTLVKFRERWSKCLESRFQVHRGAKRLSKYVIGAGPLRERCEIELIFLQILREEQYP